MLSELQQLLACRRERENRAAASLRQAKLRLEQAQHNAAIAREEMSKHDQNRQERKDKLYRRAHRARLSKADIDGLNIELDLMAETTDALAHRIKEADARVAEAAEAAKKTGAVYHRLRRDGDRFGHLVDDVAETERRRADQAEEFAIEDELGDRRASGQGGI
jgi:uncharacterized lipoprotein NlpE involved in copper resistance